MVRIPTEREIDIWLAEYVGELLALPSSEIDRDATFDSFGLDSAAAIIITGELEEWLGISIDPQVTHDYPTIRSLRCHLVTLVRDHDTAVDGSARRSDCGGT